MIDWLNELKLASIVGVFKLIQNRRYTTIKIVASNIFPEINNNLSRNLLGNLIKNVLKLGKLWTAISSRIATSGQRAEHHRKRRISPFKTLFHLSGYNFRFSRYPRVKQNIFFSIRLVTYSVLSSHWPIPNSRQATDTIPGRNIRDTWKNVVRVSKKDR